MGHLARMQSLPYHAKTTENADENDILSLSSTFSVVLVWTIGENTSKSMRFHAKTGPYGQVKT